MADELSTYTIPVILSFRDVTGQINRELGSSFAGPAKKAGTDFGNQFGQSVRQASEADIKRTTDTYAKLYDKAADATGKLKTAEAGLEDLRKRGITTGQRYTRTVEAVEKARRDEARAVRTAKDAYGDYERAVKDAAHAADQLDDAGSGIMAKLKGLGSSAGSAGGDAAMNFVEGFGGPVGALGTKGGPIGAALAAVGILGIGAGVALGKNVMAGLEREVERDKIAAQLGLSETESARFGQSSGKVYAENFGESAGDVNQALADVASTFGVGTAPEVLEDLTKKAITFRDIFGVEVAESVANAQNLITNGLAKDGAEAFDLLTASFQKVPAAMRDEIPEILNEYSTNFESLGFSGKEAFGLLVSAAPRGKIVLDKIGDSLKEFTLLATDLGSKPVQSALEGMGLNGSDVANNLLAGGDTAQEQFRQIVDSLLAIPDAGEQAAAAVTLFGTPLEDLDKSKIPQFLQSLDQADAAMRDIDGSAQRMVDTVGDNALSSVGSAMRSVETAASGVQDSLARAFGPELQKIADWVKNNQPEITGFFTGLGEAAVTAGQLVIAGLGYAAGGIGNLIAPIGDVLGAVNKFQAWQADLRGDTETADKLRAEAEEFYSMGDGLKAFSANAPEYVAKLDDIKDSLGQSAENAAASKENAQRLADVLGTMPDGKKIDITAIVSYVDTTGAVIPPDQLKVSQRQQSDAAGKEGRPGFAKGSNGVVTGPGSGTSDSILAWLSNGEGVVKAEAMRNGGGAIVTALNAGWTPSADYLHRMIPGFAEGLNPGADFLRSEIMNIWPQISTIGGKRSEDGYGEHSSGNAMDVMIPGYDTPEGKALGDAIASFVIKNASEIGLDGLIWRQTSFGYGGSFTKGTPMEDRGSDTQNHLDHLHIMLGKGRGAGAPEVGLPSSSLTMPSGYGGSGSSGGGSGTPGYGPNGEAGTYTVDRRDVAEAEGRVAEANAKVREAEARQKELEADAKESERIAAQNNLDSAKRDADEARADLDEAKRGKFTATKESASSGGSSASSGGQGGMGQFGELGSIAGSFLKETLGIDGSFLPDLSNLMPVQMAGNLLNAFSGPLQGLVDGKLGIQQPGWQPGMPVGDMQNDTGIGMAPGTSGGAFGMPNVGVPAPPDGRSHLTGPGGSPSMPGPNITIDQSQNFTNSPLGWDPAQVEKQRVRTQNQRALPKLSGISMGAGN